MNNVIKPPITDRQNMSHNLVDYFKSLILAGELNPGDRIVETKFARELQISQTPVREAMHKLSGEGIVTIVPNKGPVVNELKKSDVFEIYSLRSVIEGMAIRIATQLQDETEIGNLERFYKEMKEKLENDEVESLLAESFFIHESIIKMSKHEKLLSTYRSLDFHIRLANRILGTKSTKKKEVEQHWELIEALKQRDPEHAEKVMRSHIYRSYLEFIEEDEQSDDRNIWF